MAYRLRRRDTTKAWTGVNHKRIQRLWREEGPRRIQRLWREEGPRRPVRARKRRRVNLRASRAR